MSDYESKPYDGQHPLLDPQGDDWRTGVLERAVSYGNYAGPSNRAWRDGVDPATTTDPKYAPIDGIDAAAKTHDLGYSRDLPKGTDEWGWDGINAVSKDDHKLDSDVRTEMGQNGSKYSPGAQQFAQATEGFFGGRANAVDGMNFVEQKAGEVGNGVSGFVDGAKSWSSMGEAENGIGQGLSQAGNWAAKTGSQVAHGVGTMVDEQKGLNGVGIGAEVIGAGSAAVTGAGHLAHEAWDGAKSVGNQVESGASHLWNWLTD